MSSYPLSPAAPIQVEAEPNSGLSITRRGLKTIVGWLPGFGPGGNAGGGGPSLPAGGGIGQVLKILSLNPFKVGWAEDNIAVVNGSSLSFGQTAGTATEGNDPRVVGAMQKGQNGADIPDKGAFRTNLNLGGAASLNAGVSGGVALFDDSRIRGPGTTAGTYAAGDDPRFNQQVDTSTLVTKADPQAQKPLVIAFPAPALVTSVPQSAIDQDGVLHLGHLGADLTGTSAIDVICQKALDAIGTRIANSGSASGKKGGKLVFPMGTTALLTSGLSFGYDGPITIHGGDGLNREAVRLLQNCPVLIDLTCTATNAVAGNRMTVDVGGFCVVGNYQGGIPFRIREPDSCNVHDIRYASGDGFSTAMFRLRNVRTSNFSRMYCRNDHNLGTQADIQGAFVTLESTGGPATTLRFDKILAQSWDVGFLILNTTQPTGIEGIVCNEVEVMNSGSGLRILNQASGSYLPLQFQYTNGHLRCYREWVRASRVADLKLIGNELESDERFGNTDPMLYFTDVEGFDVSHNRIVSGRTNSVLVTDGNTNKGIFSDNTGDAVNTPIAVQCLSPSRNIKSHDNCLSLSPGATFFAGDATRNNRSQNDRAALYPGETAPADPSTPTAAPSWAGTVVTSAGASAVTQTLDIGIPGGVFSATPIATVVPANPSSVPIVATVDYGNCSATNIRVVYQRVDGQSIGAGSGYRFNAIARAAS